MPLDPRCRGLPVHHDLGPGELVQIEARGPMIGMRVRVDDDRQPETVVREERQIPVDVLAQRIDESGIARHLACQEIRLAFAPIELLDHH
jgi:hypothetical protein